MAHMEWEDASPLAWVAVAWRREPVLAQRAVSLFLLGESGVPRQWKRLLGESGKPRHWKRSVQSAVHLLVRLDPLIPLPKLGQSLSLLCLCTTAKGEHQSECEQRHRRGFLERLRWRGMRPFSRFPKGAFLYFFDCKDTVSVEKLDVYKEFQAAAL